MYENDRDCFRFIIPNLIEKSALEGDRYTFTIVTSVGHLLDTAEEYFGERDKSYTYIGVCFGYPQGPCLWYQCRNQDQ